MGRKPGWSKPLGPDYEKLARELSFKIGNHALTVGLVIRGISAETAMKVASGTYYRTIGQKIGKALDEIAAYHELDKTIKI